MSHEGDILQAGCVRLTHLLTNCTEGG